MWAPFKRLFGRRTEFRFVTSITARIWICGHPVSAISEDISASGIKLRVALPHPFHVHERYRIEIELPGERTPIVTTGCILNADKLPPDEWLLAFRFEVINADDEERIRNLARTAKKPVDRRVNTRLTACIPTKIWILGKATPAFTKDISASGIRVQVATPCRFKVGEDHRIEIELPKQPTPIRARGRIARIIVEGGPSSKWDIALHLVDLDANDQTRISEYIHRRDMERRKLDLG